MVMDRGPSFNRFESEDLEARRFEVQNAALHERDLRHEEQRRR